MGFLRTDVENRKKSIIGVVCNVSLKNHGGAQNKVEIRPEFAAFMKKSSAARKYV